MPFTTGENVGPYRIVEQLGQGGMATVFKAYHPALDRYVAIKVLHPAFREDPDFLARFQREARIVAKLDHPHIVPIYDFAEHRGHPYLVMRFIEGETLKARLRRDPPSPHEVLDIVEAVGGALSYAHGLGILHRDIKPSNIILTPDGQVFLTDFGLARMAEAGESTLSRDLMIGTPQYISPEQAKGETHLDARTDIYSLGVVLYELLVGRAPFQADTPYAVIHDHIFSPLPLPRSLNPALQETLERLLLKALAKDPADRFETVDEMVAAFRASLEPPVVADPLDTVTGAPPSTVADRAGQPAADAPAIAEPEATRPAKRLPWLWPVVAVVAVLCLCASSAFGLRLLRRARQVTPVPQADGPAAAEELLEAARTARDEGDVPAAISQYQRAVEADPALVEAYVEAADLLARGREMDRAADALARGLEANPESALLHRRMSELAALTGHWEEAQRQIEWLLEEVPGDPSVHAYAGLLVLLQGGPCVDARAELETALRLAPDLAWAHFGLALCNLDEGDLEQARAELEFVVGQEDIPPILRLRAQEELGRLGMDPQESIQRELDELLALAQDVEREDLRSALKDELELANSAWRAGDEEMAARALRGVQGLVGEHADELGEGLSAELSTRIDHILHLISEP